MLKASASRVGQAAVQGSVHGFLGSHTQPGRRSAADAGGTVSIHLGAAPGTNAYEPCTNSWEGPEVTCDHQLGQVRLAALNCECHKLAGQRHASARGDEQLFLLRTQVASAAAGLELSEQQRHAQMLALECKSVA